MKKHNICKEYPTQEEINFLFSYKDGELFWKNSKRKGRNGKKAGYKSKKGYHSIRFNGRLTYMHRLIWIMFNGEIGENLYINHIDCNPENNRIENLELVTHRQNDQRRKIHKEGKLTGCSLNKGKYRAHIVKDGVQHIIGRFKTETEAHEAYLKELDRFLASNTI